MSNRKRYNFRCLYDQKINGVWKQTWPVYCEETGYKETMVSLSGYRWRSMTSRCNQTGSNVRKHKTYSGVANNFNSFDEFVEWSRCEFGYDLTEVINGEIQPWQLDKDILGGRYYSSATCMFVPQRVNAFMTFNQYRGKHLTGTRELPSGRFEARISENGKYKYLGVFDTEVEAHIAWRKDKATQALILAQEYHTLGHRKLSDGLFMFSESMKNGWDDVDPDDWYEYDD